MRKLDFFKFKLKLVWQIMRSDLDSNFLKHAERELEFLDTDDDMNQEMRKDILQMIVMFSSQGHSGFSANYAQSVLRPLLRYEPIGPLTGEESEWGSPYDESGTRQNKRCGGVFKSRDGKSYYIGAITFDEMTEGGEISGFTNINSKQPIEFPFTPFTIHLPAGKEDETTGKYFLDGIEQSVYAKEKWLEAVEARRV